MHNLLEQLRNQTPLDVTDVVDSGSSVYIAIRYGQLSSGVVCSKRTPLKSADVSLIHRDETLRVPGVNAAELAGNIWSILDARARQAC